MSTLGTWITTFFHLACHKQGILKFWGAIRNLWVQEAYAYRRAIASCITAPDSSEKDETILKKNFQNMCSGFFFPERNFILRIFLSKMSFSFLFPDFYFRNTIISFPDFFFHNVLFINSGFFCPEKNFKFCFQIFISETQ